MADPSVINPIMAASATSGPSIEQANEILRTKNFVDAYLAAKCGELGALQCLCSPGMLEAASLLLERFDVSERRALLRTVCGCAVPGPTVVPTPTYTPVVNPTATPVATPATTAPAAPTVSCVQGLPPQGSYSQS